VIYFAREKSAGYKNDKNCKCSNSLYFSWTHTALNRLMVQEYSLIEVCNGYDIRVFTWRSCRGINRSGGLDDFWAKQQCQAVGAPPGKAELLSLG
jgi:hypothetical protein